MIELQRRGLPIVISAPSGGGKTTLCRRLMERAPGLCFSISYTTRQRRGKEQDGRDYHFVDDATFDRLIADNQLLEWAQVHGKRYGTGWPATKEQLERGIDVLFDIDVQGGRQIAERLPDTVLIFVLPPDMSTLERRLRERGSDSEEQVARRLQVAREEIEAARGLYQYWVVNDRLERALEDMLNILNAERIRAVDVDRLLDRVLS